MEDEEFAKAEKAEMKSILFLVKVCVGLGVVIAALGVAQSLMG